MKFTILFTKLLLAIFSVLLLSSKPVAKNDGEDGYSVGSTVADCTLKNVDGKMVSLHDYKHAKGFILIFTCNTCPIVKLYEDRVIKLHKDFAPQGYPVITINSNSAEQLPQESFMHMKERHAEKEYPFVYLHDPTQEVAKQFGATRTPHTFVIDKNEIGEMEVVYIGAIDDRAQNPKEVGRRYVRDAVEALIKDKRIKKSTTRAVGCTIKWSHS